MTAKQKANQARFKKVVAEAKKLRKKNPKLTQAQAVKQAWAIMYSKKKVAGYSEERNKIHKEATKWIKHNKKRKPDISKKDLIRTSYDQAAFGPAPKVGAVKKKAAKKSSSYHKDTKSHNVNIRVMSGVDSNMYKIRDGFEDTIKFYLQAIDRIKKDTIHMSSMEKLRALSVIKDYKKTIIKLKKQLRDQNKLISNLLK